ncbi:hypothetical protein B7P43_G08293 [Cryptotermes secundus]|uniref:NSUN5/RCM1 N-terminal domain-containing protein n=1 Tax=Cryptotermes secundus TaxID=105785 RepID=A0A2J7QH15_9NEOP|nr:hypothetical protein B7P43_G08293 [Cryptotermes secundus]
MSSGGTFKVPRLYKAAAKVARAVKEQNGNVEQLVQLYNKKTNTKAVAALVYKTLNNEGLLDKIIKNSEILINEANANPWLFRILIAELLLGKQRLPVGSKPVQTVLAYGPTLRTELLKATGKFHNKRNRSKSQPDVKEEDPRFGQESPTQISVSERSEDINPEMNTVMLSKSREGAGQGCIKLEEDENVKSKSKQIKQAKNKQKKSYKGSEQLPKEEKLSGSKSKKRKHTSVCERSKDVNPKWNTVVLSKSRWEAMQDFMKLEEDEYVKSESQQIEQSKNKQQRNYKGSEQLPQAEKIPVSKSKKRKCNMGPDELTLKEPKVKKAVKLHKSQHFE